jgi:GPH family glycoside/pentoside/hexuronide:cation symporter
MHDRTAPASRVSIPNRVGYGFGAIGGQIFRDTPALILPIYMITVLGIPAWMAGIAILIPKIWIIFCDPLVGRWSDRKAATWGRPRFLMFGAVLTGLTFVLMFSAPVFASPWASAAFISAAFALASTAYSLFSVPYLSVASEMSRDPAERTRVLAVRICFVAVGVAIGAGYALPVAQALGKGWLGFNRMGMVYGAICALTMLVPFLTLRRMKLIPAEAVEHSSGRSDVRAMWANRPFVVLASSYFLALTGQAMTYTVFGLYFIYIVRDAGQLAIINVFAALSVVFAQPVTVWLSRFFTKRTLFTVGVAGWAVMCLSWLSAGYDESGWIAAHLGITVPKIALLAGRGFLWGAFNSMYLLMALSMLTDTINRDHVKTGIARSGVYSGVFSALEKVAFAFGPAITGLLLSAGGFIGAKGDGVALQSPAALTTLLLCFCAYPAIMELIALLVFTRYKEQ